MLPKCFFKNYFGLFWFYTCPGKFTSARKTKHFIGVFMTAVDRIKCRYAHPGMTSGVGGFQNPGVCLQAFPSFLPHPLPAYSSHFLRGPCSETARKRLLRRLRYGRFYFFLPLLTRFSTLESVFKSPRTFSPFQC